MTEENTIAMQNIHDGESGEYGDHQGQVQWFNKKKGYGFIKNLNNPSNDIFFHFSDIMSKEYKIVYPGEFVSMNIGKNKDNQDICKNIRGIAGFPLLADNEKHHYRIIPKNNNDRISQ